MTILSLAAVPLWASPHVSCEMMMIEIGDDDGDDDGKDDDGEDDDVNSLTCSFAVMGLGSCLLAPPSL